MCLLHHLLGTLTGGACFACMCVPRLGTFLSAKRGVSRAVAVAVAFVSLWMVAYRDTLPAMVHVGIFTPTCVALNVIGGVLFIAGTWRLLRDLPPLGDMGYGLLALVAMLFGLGGLTFAWVGRWDGGTVDCGCGTCCISQPRW